MYEQKNIMKMNINWIGNDIGYPIQELNRLSVHHQMCISVHL